MSVVVFAALALAPPPPILQPHGTEAFRSILGERGLQPITDVGELQREPERTLLIVLGGHGSEQELGLDRLGLRDFVDSGGAILVATDQQTAPEWDHAFGASVAGWRIVTDEPLDRYRSEIDDPRLREFPLARPSGSLGTLLFAGSDGTLATNRPSFIPRARMPGLAPVAVLPGSSYPPEAIRMSDVDRAILRFLGITFAVAGERGAGKVMLVADHSVFINVMMLPTDCGNFEFAANSVAWLSTDLNGRGRDRCLLLDNGQPVTEFNTLSDFPDVPLPSLNQMVRAADALVVGLERENAFNRGILSMVPLPRLLSAVAVLSSLAIFVGGLAAFWSARAVPTAPAPARPVTSELFVRRLAEWSRSGDLAPLAREQAQAGLAELGLATGTPSIFGSWWQRRRLRRDLDLVQRLAQAGRRVTRSGLRQLAHSLDRLTEAVRAGVLVPPRDGGAA